MILLLLLVLYILLNLLEVIFVNIEARRRIFLFGIFKSKNSFEATEQSSLFNHSNFPNTHGIRKMQREERKESRSNLREQAV